MMDWVQSVTVCGGAKKGMEKYFEPTTYSNGYSDKSEALTVTANRQRIQGIEEKLQILIDLQNQNRGGGEGGGGRDDNPIEIFNRQNIYYLLLMSLILIAIAGGIYTKFEDRVVKIIKTETPYAVDRDVIFNHIDRSEVLFPVIQNDVKQIQLQQVQMQNKLDIVYDAVRKE